MNENLNGRFDFTARIIDRAETCDLSDDYTLPDYMPAIGRVISCTATVAPPTLYLGGGNLEFAGGIRYRLLYESAEDSSLWCYELPGEYDFLIPADRLCDLPEDLSELSGISDAKAENISARITAPRRLTIKSKIRLKSALCCRSVFETKFRGDLNNTDAIRTLEGVAACGIVIGGSSTPVVCHDKITFSEAGFTDNSNYRLISSRGNVMISRMEKSTSSLDCRGELNATIILSSENPEDRPRKITRKIPFSVEIPFGDYHDSAANHIGLRASGVCPNISMSTDEEGINLEATIIISAEAAATSRITYLKDIYSRKADCETSRTSLVLPIPQACFNGNVTISSSANLSDIGLDSGMRILDCIAHATPTIEKEITTDGKLIISGKLKINVIADNGAELIPSEFESPFKYVTEIQNCKNIHNPVIDVITAISDIKCRIDGGKLTSDCELCFAILLENEVSINAISEVNFTSAEEQSISLSKILICYPTLGETLWDVAKKYRSDAFEIAEKNSLSVTEYDDPNSLSNSKFIII